MLKYAYRLGATRALVDAGLVKTALPLGEALKEVPIGRAMILRALAGAGVGGLGGYGVGKATDLDPLTAALVGAGLGSVGAAGVPYGRALRTALKAPTKQVDLRELSGLEIPGLGGL